jgi:integral membrane protein
MLRFFRTIATLEGISLLLLFFVAMPLKYAFDMPLMVKYVGWAHGLLFVAYVGLATMLKIEDNWPWKQYLIILLASLVPFGTFYIEKKYFKTAN